MAKWLSSRHIPEYQIKFTQSSSQMYTAATGVQPTTAAERASEEEAEIVPSKPLHFSGTFPLL